ncbi:MAG: stage III sporulation protein AB [Clostridia bacterium]|nr:stage III sporulation protein AB [Clostridia bacterium]
MLKLIGSALIFLCATYVGMSKYQELYKRKRVLSGVRDGAIKIRDNLRCMCMPLYESFLSSGEFFENAASNIRKGQLPTEAVKEAFNANCHLNARDRECIRRFADGLGAGDCKGQLANVEMFISEMDRCVDHAEKELGTKGTLFIRGSILTAAAVVLLMI